MSIFPFIYYTSSCRESSRYSAQESLTIDLCNDHSFEKQEEVEAQLQTTPLEGDEATGDICMFTCLVHTYTQMQMQE